MPLGVIVFHATWCHSVSCHSGSSYLMPLGVSVSHFTRSNCISCHSESYLMRLAYIIAHATQNHCISCLFESLYIMPLGVNVSHANRSHCISCKSESVYFIPRRVIVSHATRSRISCHSEPYLMPLVTASVFTSFMGLNWHDTAIFEHQPVHDRPIERLSYIRNTVDKIFNQGNFHSKLQFKSLTLFPIFWFVKEVTTGKNLWDTARQIQ